MDMYGAAALNPFCRLLGNLTGELYELGALRGCQCITIKQRLNSH